MNNISLASYSFHGKLAEGKCNIFSYLESLKYHYNVGYADIWTGFLPTLDDAFINSVRGAMDKLDLGLANLCVDGPTVWVEDSEQRAANRTKMLEYIKAADKLGAKTIRIDFGKGTDGNDAVIPDEAFEYLVKTYSEYCSICGDLGMKIGPENHWGWDRVPANLKRVKEAVNHPAYGHLFHFTNFYENNFEEGNEIAISYAMHTHVPANSLPVAKDLMRRLAASGYTGTFSVEHHSGKFEDQRVEWQLGAVRNFVEELKEEGLDAPTKPDYFAQTFNK